MEPKKPSYHQLSQGDSLSAVTSKWNLGWATLSLIVGFYFLSVFTAITHSVMFLKLDGRIVEEVGYLSQPYVTTMSTLLANVFKTSLCISLSVAFTQHLWHVLRSKALQVSTIERLFTVRSSVLPYFSRTALVSAPWLFAIANFMLVLSIAKIFPPGALTVTSQAFETAQPASAVTFQPGTTGNGSVAGAQSVRLGTGRLLTSNWRYLYTHPRVLGTGRSTLLSAEIPTSGSPCGANCSYSQAFDGPYFMCQETISLSTEQPFYAGQGQPRLPYFSANFAPEAQMNPGDVDDGDNVHFQEFIINMSTPLGQIKDSDDLLALNLSETIIDEKTNITSELDWWLVETTRLDCSPAWATYNFRVEYADGERKLWYSTSKEQPLAELYAARTSYPEAFSCHPTGPTCTDAYNKFDFTDKQIRNMKVTDMYALIDSVWRSLAGTHPAYMERTTNDTREYVYPNATSVNLYPSPGRLKHGVTERYLGIDEFVNSTIIHMTKFNRNRESPDITLYPDIQMSADLVNEALANVTFAVMYSMPFWRVDAEATTSKFRNIYSFSRPINLIIPYSVSLFLAVPLLAIGVLALWRNGVPAADGGFVQLLMTTTGSHALREAAAGGCLGGDENVPEALKKLTVRYGELRGVETIGLCGDTVVTVNRAGFGVEHEIVPLDKGHTYGSKLV